MLFHKKNGYWKGNAGAEDYKIKVDIVY